MKDLENILKTIWFQIQARKTLRIQMQAMENILKTLMILQRTVT